MTRVNKEDMRIIDHSNFNLLVWFMLMSHGLMLSYWRLESEFWLNKKRNCLLKRHCVYVHMFKLQRYAQWFWKQQTELSSLQKKFAVCHIFCKKPNRWEVYKNPSCKSQHLYLRKPREKKIISLSQYIYIVNSI